MSTKLSVNLNKIALIRNSRDTTIPNLVEAAKTCIQSGAEGITVHPRPDMRHVRPQDVYDLAELLSKPEYSHIEFNIEGNPQAGAEKNGYPGFLELVKETKPDQCTLVPDDPTQLTSDHGWDLKRGHNSELQFLASAIADLKKHDIRISIFMDPDEEQINLTPQTGTDRIELYTGPYADTYGTDKGERIFQEFMQASILASDLGIGLNAGHDLNLKNLAHFCTVEGLLEVSIGHALVTDAIWMGLANSVSSYRKILDNS